ncbi:hypothetical protein O181_054642 [Austropuccinia psidii MF-1]|uniref:Uncharacterized protein n=1 Tax=Austropuccinia psidii MF-1 TaxID=1389203 RepID=A0A9Q3E7B1_9BASI|nr:hypothetical protein [Austropuccinia psidii MF-1]
MSSKLTELTESSPSLPPPPVLCGSAILSQLDSPWSMASSGHFDPAQTYDGYKADEGLDPACTECWQKGRTFFNIKIQGLQSSIFDLLGRCHAIILDHRLPSSEDIYGRNVARWTNVGGPIPVDGRPIYYSSEVPIYRINTKGVVKRIRKISDSPPNPDAEGSD